MAVEFLLRGEEATIRAGEAIGRLLSPGDLVLLDGELGSGKTTLVRGVARALGAKEAVTSPTYAIMNEYTGPVPIVHIDLYRLVSPEQLPEIGFEDYLDGSAIVLVEWPDRLGEWRREARVSIRLAHEAGGRRMWCEGVNPDLRSLSGL